MTIARSLQLVAAVEGAAQAVHNLSPPGSTGASPSELPSGAMSPGNDPPASSAQAHPGSAASPYAREGVVYPQGATSGDSAIHYFRYHRCHHATVSHWPWPVQGVHRDAYLPMVQPGYLSEGGVHVLVLVLRDPTTDSPALAGGIWPPDFDSPSNWALILTATSSTITCVAVIFLVLLFLAFR